MKPVVEKTIFTIDGSVAEPDATWIHWQEDPYPGGHTWSVEVRGKHLDSFIQKVGVGDFPSPSREALWFFYCALQPLVSRKDAAFRWVLNTVEVLSVREDVATARGICSPFIK